MTTETQTRLAEILDGGTPYYCEVATYCEECAPSGAEPCTRPGGPEVDEPLYCDKCGDLLTCTLSAAGLDYVANALLDGLLRGCISPPALAAWLEFSPEAVMPGVREALYALIASDCTDTIEILQAVHEGATDEHMAPFVTAFMSALR